MGNNIKPKKKTKKYNMIQNTVYVIKDLYRYSKHVFFFTLFEIILGVVTPLFGIFLPAITVFLVESRADASTVLITLGGFGLAMVVTRVVFGICSEGKYFKGNAFRSIFYTPKLFIHAQQCEFENIESAKGQQDYTLAMSSLNYGDWSGPNSIVAGVVEFLVPLFSFFIYSSYIGTLNIFVVLLLIAFSVINLLLSLNATKYQGKKAEDQAIYDKKLNYLQYTSEEIKAGKDIRLYEAQNIIMKLKDLALDGVMKIKKQVEQRYFVCDIARTILTATKDLIAYGYLIYAISNGLLPISGFLLYFGMITAFSSQVDAIVAGYVTLTRGNIRMNEYRKFIDNDIEKDPINPTDISNIKDYTIKFEDVSFSYENDDVYQLKNFNATIEHGKSIALIGVNGAGKTTLIKLLCGFYKPNKGKITIGGVDISTITKKDLYSLMSAVFQDVFIGPFTVLENITMKEKEKSDVEKVNECLKKVGLYDRVYQHSQNIDAYTVSDFEDGLTLSGGQQQKLIMARALYKDSPILFLDEPTSALDPIAESEVYSQFHEISLNKTTIFVSHRLASTQFCDKILVISDGNVKEEGTHSELMELGKEYAKMFEIQSHYYKEENDEKEGNMYEVS